VRSVALPRDVREPAVTRIERFCQERVRPDARSEMRLEHSVRGNAITIVERRAPWSKRVGPEWTSMKIAQLRYDPSDRTWTLYCADRNERWWPYHFAEPSADVEALLGAIDEDPTGIFWG
jgi:hypothetical protein